MPALLEIKAKVLHQRLYNTDWEEDLSCGVPQLGFLSKTVGEPLLCAARAVQERFVNEISPQSKKNVFGLQLFLILSQCLDCLLHLPMFPSHAVALGAHTQCLVLELWGYLTYVSIVAPRIADGRYDARGATLPIRGAFTVDGAVAQELFCVGIPFWFIQTLTHRTVILKVVQPLLVNSALSLALEAKVDVLPWNSV
ncbi:hypothetical protein SCP_0105910 [Sparassis crispa]|uniref:Uncharacterized protein n=1 Tax=Sparassis crispa TaxID=139825 RepID=A0A401G6C5_9APHY|nr:hypothetical protein SCP_0105910 [Sparassis crispa]GBE77709.1 hypothetical protein SCP_0105910 [Sparassis crispa]